MRRIAYFAAFLLLFASFALLRAHAQMVGGSISGTVTDASGAAVSGATVTVRNEETGTERHLTTDAQGRYSAPSVTIGRWSVSAEKDGFARQTLTAVPVVVGQAVTADIRLTVGEVSQAVSVVDTPPVVNLSTQQTAGLVDERAVKELPLNGRSYDQLLTLNPGVVNYTGQRSGSVGTSNSSVGAMFSVAGRRPQDNIFLLNGIEYTGASLINVTPGGASGQLLGVDAVREFNVITDTYGANYGKRQGAQISIVTASGTNQYHGNVYEFLRNSSLDARNYFDQPGANGKRLPQFQRNNFGGSVGGPIRKDKLLLFANYEGYRQNLGLSNKAIVPNDRARQGYVPNSSGTGETYVGVAPGAANLLNLWPRANGPDLGSGLAYAYSNPVQRIREDFGTTRFDWNLGSKDQFFSVYTVDDSTAHTPTVNPLTWINEDVREQVTSLQEQHVFSPRLLNTARFGYSRAAFFFTGEVPVDGVTPFVVGRPVGAIVIAGSTASNGVSQVSTAGANVGSNNRAVRNLFTFDDHIFYTVGRHQIEAGVWLQRLQANDLLAQNQYGQASFSTLTTFLQGTAATFSVVPAPTALGFRALFGAGFVEDTFRITPRLEIRAGFRFESASNWSEAQNRAANYKLNNWVIDTNPTVGKYALYDNKAKFLPEPRLGLSWSPFASGKTAIRLGVGIHRALLDNLDYRLTQVAPFNTTLAFKNIPVSSLAITPSTTAAAGSLISPSNVQPDIRTPTVIAWSLRVEQQIANNTSLTVGYAGSRGYHQIVSGDLNEPPAVVCPNPSCPASLAAGTVYYPTTTKLNPNVANTTSWWSAANSFYSALQVDVRRQFSHGLQIRGNYTFARNLDNGSAWNTSVSANTPAFVSVPYFPKLDWGRAATDIKHNAAINGTWEIPFAHRLSSGVARQTLDGWTVSSIANLQSGFPFTPQLGYNPTGSGDTRNPVRPDVNPNFNGDLYPHTVNQWFNPAAFSAPHYGAVGNLGRDTLTGPHLLNVDLSLLKRFKVGERVNAQFRAEAFNFLNHTNFALPNPTVFSSGPTQGTAANQTTAAVASSTAGAITATSTTSRQLQFGLKLAF
ncbi:TonB-dependent receptor [Terriglobus albidus]|uniref:TonB-dependent receptor n=1 Tax=Terriglobus albidus TaxID=1592106 RepID=UPI0021E0826B|nr:carboxypeptidase-like regulatory domain-containing protein [Terriglobus albidus]